MKPENKRELGRKLLKARKRGLTAWHIEPTGMGELKELEFHWAVHSLQAIFIYLGTRGHAMTMQRKMEVT